LQFLMIHVWSMTQQIFLRKFNAFWNEKTYNPYPWCSGRCHSILMEISQAISKTEIRFHWFDKKTKKKFIGLQLPWAIVRPNYSLPYLPINIPTSKVKIKFIGKNPSLKQVG
jgi:hypothetical protein